MANSINKAAKYIPVLDQKYVEVAKTSILDTTVEGRYEEGVNQFYIATIATDGLGDYKRDEGYAKSKVELKWTAYKPDYERSASFAVDVLDNEESMNVVLATLSENFYTTQVGPEIDSVRIAKYASTEGVHEVEEKIETAEEALAALRKCITYENNKAVPQEGRILFISYELFGSIEDLDTYKSRAALNGFTVVCLSANKLKTAVKLYSGFNGEHNGFEVAPEAKDINFMCVPAGCVMQTFKHVSSKWIPASANQTMDADLYMYRMMGLNEIYKEKADCVYVSVATE